MHLVAGLDCCVLRQGRVQAALVANQRRSSAEPLAPAQTTVRRQGEPGQRSRIWRGRHAWFGAAILIFVRLIRANLHTRWTAAPERLGRVAADQEDGAPQLSPQILLLDVVRVFHLAPLARLPADLQARRLGRFLDAEAARVRSAPRLRKRFAPVVDQSDAHQQALGRQHRALQAGELEGGEPRQPSAYHLLRHLGLCDGQDAVGLEDGLDLDARPDVGGEVGDDGRGCLHLQLPQRLAVAQGVVHDLLGRPAQQRVGVEVAHEQREHVVPDVGLAFGVGPLDVQRAGRERRHGYVVRLGGLLRAEQEVPLERNRRRELVLRRRDREYVLVGRAHRPAVEVNLQAVCKC